MGESVAHQHDNLKRFRTIIAAQAAGPAPTHSAQ
jgi:hypothetical protein